MNFQLPDQAWERLPAAEWNDEAARHLLRRAGWTARPEEVDRTRGEGLEATLDRIFPASPVAFERTPLLVKFEAEAVELRRNARGTTGRDRQAAQRDLRERSQAALQEFGISWLQTAATPQNAVFAKWVLFLSDVYVVSAQKVRNAGFVWRHFELLGQHALGRAPDLTKAMARSPAMAVYLDLVRSDKAAPNENFARELFELFILGEGNYTEQDIKEAARAFTGYRMGRRTGEVDFNPRRHDAGAKTIFGKSGAFDGEAVIDLAYEQKSAAEFLPRELARYYLSHESLPPELIGALGARWRKGGFDLRGLARDFFGSRVFFAPEFRGNFIKSPVQFYLGLIQDLELSVPPLPRYSSARLRQMGQSLFQPPNVRGWVGGRAWINSSTLAVRRQLAQQLFSPLPEETLNADEVASLAEARTKGRGNFTVSREWSDALDRGDAGVITERLVELFLPGRASPGLRRTLEEFIGSDRQGESRTRHLRTAVIALLQTPNYQLC